MTRNTIATRRIQFAATTLAGFLIFGSGIGNEAVAQSTNSSTPASTSPGTPASLGAATSPSGTRAQRRAARRRARAAKQQAAQPTQPADTRVEPTAAQRSRDAQLLAAQKKQSATSAKENDELTQKVVQDQQRQQAEPRIQDAPGPESQPLAGDPAVSPVQASEPPRVQDAPGPAQTLPKAPPTTPAPAPAPQT